MGYTTDFFGRFDLNKKLDEELHEFLIKFNHTRRMARKVDSKYGIEGEFYVDGGGDFGQEHDSTIINYNKPPITQPSLWCQWVPSKNGLSIEWDGGEKFYCYAAWLKYIIANFLAPKGYILTGKVAYQGEDNDDFGYIEVINNIVHVASRVNPFPSFLKQE